MTLQFIIFVIMLLSFFEVVILVSICLFIFVCRSVFKIFEKLYLPFFKNVTHYALRLIGSAGVQTIVTNTDFFSSNQLITYPYV